MIIGWICLHRKLLEWEWYSDTNVFRVFVHCLLKANWEPKTWQGIEIKRGQFVSSLNNISTELGLTLQQTRTAFDKLKSTNEVTIKTTNKYSLISITCYETYQDANKQITNEQQTNNTQDNKPITTTKQYNNITNKQCVGEKRTRFVPPTQFEVEQFFIEKNWTLAKLEAEKFVNFYESKNWYVGKNKMKSWKGAAANWMARSNERAQQTTGYKTAQEKRSARNAEIFDYERATKW